MAPQRGHSDDPRDPPTNVRLSEMVQLLAPDGRGLQQKITTVRIVSQLELVE